MNNEQKIIMSSSIAKKMRKGYPLIPKDAIRTREVIEEGTILYLVDEMGQFIGKGYYGKQNKGCGWLLTNQQQELIDIDFFVRILIEAKKRRQHLYEDMETTAFRIFNGEGDGVGGLTIDYFAGCYVLTWYSLGIYRLKEII